MEPDEVVRTLGELEAERSGDVLLLRALAKRFHANADEFFPPQIDASLGAFARLGYSDEALLRGFAGRLSDLASDASPRRVVRLLRHGAALQFRPHDWLEGLLPQLHQQMPNLREGLPAVLEALHSIRWHDPELLELLATQGLIVTDDLDNDVFFTRFFERWSRHGIEHNEIEEQAVSLAKGGGSSPLDLRDSLNLLAGLYRCTSSTTKEAREFLESQLTTRLAGAGSRAESAVIAAGTATPGEEAVLALEWMQRLSLRSPQLWRACAESIEVALQDPKFAREHLPAAIHALAALSGAGGGKEEGVESNLVAALLNAPETRKAASKLSAQQALHLLLAASLLRLPATGVDLPLARLLRQAARMARQLPLPERRALVEAAESLGDEPEAKEGGKFSADLASIRALPIAALPPLMGAAQADWGTVDVGPRALLLPPGGGELHGVHLLGFRDTFAAPVPKKKKTKANAPTTPSCRLSARALELQGWSVQLTT